LFDAYESDLPFLAIGDKIDFSFQALPGLTFSGKIKFIDPVIDPVNRVARVRVEINNPDGKLKPEMFATGIVKSNSEEYRNKLVIPRSAVLWTGKRSVVYVKLSGFEESVFKMREIELGPQLGDSYIVADGLNEGEEIVSQGAFSIDAAAQLDGKPSMMNPSPTTSGKDNFNEEKTQTTSDMDKENGGVQNHFQQSSDVKNSKEIKFSETKLSPETLISGHLRVSGICDLCKERIEKAAKSVSGVKTAEWSAETLMLDYSFDSSKCSVDEVAKVIAASGHDNEKAKAPDSFYKTLPECCWYKRMN
jgi:membrane fusion protein, copper/silver efflux system